MERNLMWGSLGIGALGWLCAFLMAQSKRTDSAVVADTKSPDILAGRAWFWLAFSLPIAVWIGTLPTSPPFSAGQGFGRGFLLGGLSCGLGAFVVMRAASVSSSSAQRAATTAPLFASLMAICVPLIWMRPAVIEALLGLAIGWLATSLILHFGLGREENVASSNVASSQAKTEWISFHLLSAAAFTTMLCAVAALGVYRDFVFANVARGTYSAVAVTLAAGGALALLCGALLPELQPETKAASRPLALVGAVFSFAFALIVPTSLGALLGTKILDDLSLIYVVGAGATLGLLLRWMLWSAPNPAGATSALPLAILVSLGGFMFGYQLMQGFGVGLMLLAAWPFSLLYLPSPEELTSDVRRAAARFEAAQTLSLSLCFLTILLLSRLFATHYRAELRGAGLTDQFALFGFVAGAMLPGFLGSLAHNPGQKAAPTRILGALALGLVLLGAMISLWGIKIGPAFFAGLALGSAGWSFAALRPGQRPAIALISLSIGVTLTQWAGRLVPLSELSRAGRLHLLLWTLGGLIVAVLVVDYGSRLVLRGRHKREIVAPASGVSL